MLTERLRSCMQTGERLSSFPTAPKRRFFPMAIRSCILQMEMSKRYDVTQLLMTLSSISCTTISYTTPRTCILTHHDAPCTPPRITHASRTNGPIQALTLCADLPRPPDRLLLRGGAHHSHNLPRWSRGLLLRQPPDRAPSSWRT